MKIELPKIKLKIVSIDKDNVFLEVPPIKFKDKLPKNIMLPDKLKIEYDKTGRPKQIIVNDIQYFF